EFHTGIALDGLNEFCGKGWICGEWFGPNDAGDFPQAGGRVLAGGLFTHAAEAGDGAPAARIEDVGGENFPEAEREERGQVEGRLLGENMAERVGVGIAVSGGV